MIQPPLNAAVHQPGNQTFDTRVLGRRHFLTKPFQFAFLGSHFDPTHGAILPEAPTIGAEPLLGQALAMRHPKWHYVAISSKLKSSFLEGSGKLRNIHKAWRTSQRQEDSRSQKRARGSSLHYISGEQLLGEEGTLESSCLRWTSLYSMEMDIYELSPCWMGFWVKQLI